MRFSLQMFKDSRYHSFGVIKIKDEQIIIKQIFLYKNVIKLKDVIYSKYSQEGAVKKAIFVYMDGETRKTIELYTNDAERLCKYINELIKEHASSY